MNSTKTRSHRILFTPVLGAVILMILSFLIIGCTYILGNVMSEELSQLVVVALLFLFLLAYKAWFRPDYKGCLSFGFLNQKQILLYVLIFLVIDAATILVKIPRLGFTAPALMVFSQSLVAAVGEETMNRVMPISISMHFCRSKKSVLILLFITAIVFSVLHAANIEAGQPVNITLVQLTETLGAGLFFGALYLRTGSIIPCMFLHFMNNFLNGMISVQTSGISVYTMTTYDYIESLILVAAEIVFTVLLLHGHMDEILALWKKIWNLPEKNPETEQVNAQ